mgnify:CR=1 FL=1
MCTRRMRKMIKFYSDALGIGPFLAYPDEKHMGCNVNGVYLGFDSAKAVSGTSEAVTIWFTVDDLHETFERCLSLGARVRDAPNLKPWGDITASVYDLDGNVLGLVHRKRNQFVSGCDRDSEEGADRVDDAVKGEGC